MQGSIFDQKTKQGRIHDSISRRGWAGAVIWRAVGDAVNMTATVAYDWAGAVIQKPLAQRRKSKGETD